MISKTIDSNLFSNIIYNYQQLESFNLLFEKYKNHHNNRNSLNLTESTDRQIRKAKKMSTTTSATMKFKTLWCSLFQAQHTVTLKQMKHVDNTYENDSNEYRLKREKNNESVRKSRAKNRIKLHECASHVQNLKNENVQLNKTLSNLESELFTLKGLFQHCFSFNLNNLPFKPSDIPTSTLYKIIMNKKDLKAPMPNAIASAGPVSDILSQTNSSENNHPLMLKKIDSATSKSSTDAKYNETDKFFINQIKNALTNIVKYESNPKEANMKIDYDLNTIQMVNDHDYSLKQNTTLPRNF